MNMKHIQKGFSAIIALVLIVLLALLGIYMATLSNVSSFGTTQSLGSMQAWFAAKSGFQWAVQRVISTNACFTAADGNFATTGDGDFTINAGGINNFNITVSCAAAAYTEASTTYNVYTIASTSERGAAGDITYISRTINAKVTDFP